MPSIRLFVRLSVYPIPLAQNGALYGCGHYRTLIGIPMLDVKSTGQHGQVARMVTKSSPALI